MNKVKSVTQPKQPLFDMYLEYSESAKVFEKEYRDLEGRFALAFGYLPIRIEDDTFPFLTDRQQDACKAFWSNLRVVGARKSMLGSRTLAEAYFNAYADSAKK